MIQLDRMELGDCFTPQELVNEIFRQCPNLTLPIPIEDIAKAAGIHTIEAMPTDELEGMLVADEGKDVGVIMYKESSPIGRQRFTIGHELGHFLLLHHGANQSCTPKDIKFFRSVADVKLLESEANEFAQLILMPDDKIDQEINAIMPSMEALKVIVEKFDMSFEAIANKCASHSHNPFALVYSKDGIVRYCWRDWKKFPHWIPFVSGDSLPIGSIALQDSPEESISDQVEVDPVVWVEKKYNKPLPSWMSEQTYTQLDGYKVTLLCLA